MFSPLTFAQGDGPRAYQLVPEGTQSIGQFLFALRGNNTPSNGLVIENADIDLNLGVTQYALALDINGHQAGLLAIVPYGNASGSVQTAFGELSGHDSGIGDAMLGFAYGIYGTPSLSLEEYVGYDPGFAMALLLRATLPTGSYNSDNNLNMGGNRWALEIGTPIMYYIGTSYLNPDLTSLEILPKITLFGDNSDAVGGTEKLKQNPLFSLEGHLTRNFGQAFWASLDALYEYGGETTSDGVDDGNKQRALSFGVTAAMNLSQSASVKLSYGEVVSGNSSGSDAEMLRLQFMLLF